MLTMQSNYYTARSDTRLNGPVIPSQLTNYPLQNQQIAHQQQHQQQSHSHLPHPHAQQQQQSQAHSIHEELRLPSIISSGTVNNDSMNPPDLLHNSNSSEEHLNFSVTRQSNLRRDKIIHSQDWIQNNSECNMKLSYVTGQSSSSPPNEELSTSTSSSTTTTTHLRLNCSVSNGHSPSNSSPSASPTTVTTSANNTSNGSNNNNHNNNTNSRLLNQQFYSDINLIRQSNDLISNSATNVYGRNGPKELDYLLAANAAAALVSQLGGGTSVNSLNSNLTMEQLNNNSKLIQHRDMSSVEQFTSKDLLIPNDLRYNSGNNNNANTSNGIINSPNATNNTSSMNLSYEEQQRLMYSGAEQKYPNSNQIKSYSNSLLNPFNGTNFMRPMVQSNGLMTRNPNNSFQSNTPVTAVNSNNNNTSSNDSSVNNDSRSHLYDISSFSAHNPYSLTNPFHHFNSRPTNQSYVNESMKLNGNLSLRDTNYHALLNGSPFGNSNHNNNNNSSSSGSVAFRSLINPDTQSSYLSNSSELNQSIQGVLMNSSIDNANSLLNDNNSCTGQSLRQNSNSSDTNVVVYPWMNPKGSAANGYEEVTLFLLKRGAKIDLMDRDGWQAIHIAACWCQLEVVELLVNFGADIMAETKSGETVFNICEDLEMKSRLLEIKQEMERKKCQQQDLLNRPGKPRELARRRSSTNPRSASIRRTSMREKKMISWKEAKQEAEMRGVTAATDDKDAPKPFSPIPNGSTDHVFEKPSLTSESHGATSSKNAYGSIRSSHPGLSSKPPNSPISSPVLTQHGTARPGKVQQNETVITINGSPQSPNLRASSRIKEREINQPKRNIPPSTPYIDSSPAAVHNPSPATHHRTVHDKERIVRIPSSTIQNTDNSGTLTRKSQQTEYSGRSPPSSTPNMSPHHTLSPQPRHSKNRTASGIDPAVPDQPVPQLKSRINSYENAQTSSLPRRDGNQGTDSNNQPFRGEKRSSTRKRKSLSSEQKPSRNENRETDISIHNAYYALPASNNQFQNNHPRNEDPNDNQNITLRSPNINRNDFRLSSRTRLSSGQQNTSGQVVHATATIPRRELITYGDDLGSRPSGKCCLIM